MKICFSQVGFIVQAAHLTEGSQTHGADLASEGRAPTNSNPFLWKCRLQPDYRSAVKEREHYAHTHPKCVQDMYLINIHRIHLLVDRNVCTYIACIANEYTYFFYLSMSIRQQTKIIYFIIPHTFSHSKLSSFLDLLTSSKLASVFVSIYFFIFLPEEEEVSYKAVRGEGGIKSQDNPHPG